MNLISCLSLSRTTSKLLSASLLFGSLAGMSGCGIERHTEPVTAAAVDTASPEGTKYELRLHHLHTGESIDVVYRIGDKYVPEAIDQLNHFLRDSRTDAVSHYDPREFDTLHELLATLHRNDATIDIVCGYRTPWSNNFLRTRRGRASYKATGVAEHSQHMLAKAIDIRVPGVKTLVLRNAALSLHAGGVGYYPTSQFVHVDVGPVRQWTYGGRHSREG
ncbi:MAG: DUF882 domain-containing protein [Acidobacteriaceae bacterium]|nr:DUF882 domain-containing protein [Acidobacteriaceae bacterium]